MKKDLKSIALGFLGGMFLIAVLAASYPSMILRNSAGKFFLESPLICSNGVTVCTNIILQCSDLPSASYKISVTNLATALTVATNNAVLGSN